MSSRRTSSVPTKDGFSRQLYCDLRCPQTCPRGFQTCGQHSQACGQHSRTCGWCFQACGQRFQACGRRFQACGRRSQACSRHSQACGWHSLNCGQRSQDCGQRSYMLPGALKVLSGTPWCSETFHTHSHGTPVPVITDLSFSEGQPDCPPRV